MNWKGFKPQLLSNEDYNLEELDYSNMLASIKYDGVRIEATREGLFGRSLKALENPELQDKFRDFYETIPEGVILEGEMYHNDKPCREISGICDSSHGGKDLRGFHIRLFDAYDLNADMSQMTYFDRLVTLSTIYNTKCLKSNLTSLVEHFLVRSYHEATIEYKYSLKNGYEGLVLMDGTKPYKRGRVTIKQHIGFKMKPHKYEDLEIIGVNERFINTNKSEINELGHKYKRNTVKDKQATGIAATFECKMDSGSTTKVTITGTEAERREIWNNKADYIGRYAVVKSMDYGVKDKPRIGRLVGIKNKSEK
jgi:hypothetical protein